MQTYITSDFHFSHKNIVGFTNRGKETTVEDHDDWLVEVWNRDVKNEDKVFHLGDFSFSTNYDKIALQVSKLKGQKFFLKGNHDRAEFMLRLKEDRLIQEYYEYKEIKLLGNTAVLFHFPIASWHKQNYGSLMLHGHSHGGFTGTKGKRLDVGIDSSYNLYGAHRLFSEKDIQDYMELQEVQVADAHRSIKEKE